MAGIKPRMGAPEFKPTIHQRHNVISLVVAGFDNATIARVVNIDVKTLNKHFDNELKNALSMRVKKVANRLYRSAIGGDVRAQEFFLKCKAGWNPNRVEEKDNNDIKSLLEQLVEQGKKK